MIQYQRIPREKLMETCEHILIQAGCDVNRASIVADVCIEADMRGIPSHGIARLERYVAEIQKGKIRPQAEPKIVFQTSLSAVFDGNHCVGQYGAKIASEKAVQLAHSSGVGMVTVRNSNHYGIAGYWAEQIMKNEMIGISLTNTAPLVVPTYSKEALLGTNPIAISFPSKNQMPFMVDMATSVVSRGKLEVYARNEQEIPSGWALTTEGQEANDPSDVLQNLQQKAGGGLVPLGGETESHGGHKGYGLALLVELFTAGLSGGNPSSHMNSTKGSLCHYFMAIRLDLFGNTETLLEHISHILLTMKEGTQASPLQDIILANEKEYSSRMDALKYGVQIDLPTLDQIQKMGEKISGKV